MAYSSTAPLSYLGSMAAGVIVDGEGFATATKEITALTKAEANGQIQLTASARQASNQPNSSAIDTLCNRDISGSGAFTGTVPDDYTSTVGTGMAMDRLQAHADLMFGSNPIQMAQTFFIAEAFASQSERLAPTLNKLNEGVDFGQNPVSDTFVYPEDGVFPNYLGSAYTDYQAVVTNGVSSLVTNPTKANFELLASDLANVGSAFNVVDVANFGNPGQVIIAISNVDGLSITGLDVVLNAINLRPEQIFNLGNSEYNVITQRVLDAVNIPELVSNAQQLLGSNIANLEHLGQITDFDKIFVNSKDVITFSSMEEFRSRLQAIELGNIETVAQLSAYINVVEPVVLPTIDNRTNFVERNYVDTMIARFVGGTGTYNSITVGDMIGILGGVGVSTPASNYRTAIKALYDAGELNDIRSRISELTAGLNGSYTTEIAVGPPREIQIVDPFTSTVHANTAPDLEITAYASFQAAKIGQIEAACAALMSRRNVNSDIQTAIDAWRAISKKIFDEKEFQTRTDMNYNVRTTFSDIASSFVQQLRTTINQRAKAPIIKGMIEQSIRDGEIGGEYTKAYVAELENKIKADAYDIRWRAEFDE